MEGGVALDENMERQMSFMKDLASSEEANDIVVAVARLFEKHPGQKDDVLDFITGLLMSRYESPARAIFQAETMKFLCLVKNMGMVMPHIDSLLDFFKLVKGGRT